MMEKGGNVMSKAVVCPVCKGRGFVQGGFYSTTTGCWSSSGLTEVETCLSCDGKGYVVI
jgi:DnaJ-class molecular chaperone